MEDKLTEVIAAITPFVLLMWMSTPSFLTVAFNTPLKEGEKRDFKYFLRLGLIVYGGPLFASLVIALGVYFEW